jgi:hypothetical protein
MGSRLEDDQRNTLSKMLLDVGLDYFILQYVYLWTGL